VGLSGVVLTPVDKALSRQTEAVDAFTKLPIKAPGKATAKITRAPTFPLSYLISLERIQLPFDHSTPSSQQLQPTVLDILFTTLDSLDILTPHARPCRTRGLAHPRPSMALIPRSVETPVRTPNACNRQVNHCNTRLLRDTQPELLFGLIEQFTDLSPTADVENLNQWYSSGDQAYIIIASAMVLVMVPGLGFLYSGLARRKSALSLIWACMFSATVITFQWYFWGYSLAFSQYATNGFIGDLQKFGLMKTLGAPSPGSPLIPDLLYAFYQVPLHYSK
jgi:hypothetical protein